MLIKLIIELAIGGLCGFAANKLMKGDSKSIIKNVILGVVGGIVGGLLGNLTVLAEAGSAAYFFPSAALAWLYGCTESFLNNRSRYISRDQPILQKSLLIGIEKWEVSL